MGDQALKTLCAIFDPHGHAQVAPGPPLGDGGRLVAAGLRDGHLEVCLDQVEPAEGGHALQLPGERPQIGQRKVVEHGEVIQRPEITATPYGTIRLGLQM